MSHIIKSVIIRNFIIITDKKNDNVRQLQIIDDKKPITEKKSVISACNVDYRLKRSGPK